MTRTENLRRLIAHTLTEADAAFKGTIFAPEDFKRYSENDLREFVYRHHAPAFKDLFETIMV